MKLLAWHLKFRFLKGLLRLVLLLNLEYFQLFLALGLIECLRVIKILLELLLRLLVVKASKSMSRL